MKSSQEVNQKMKIAIALLALFFTANVNAQVVTGHKLTTGQIIVGVTGAAPVANTLTGTANQITVTQGAEGGNMALSFPSNVTMTNLTVTGTLSPYSTGTFTSNDLAATYGLNVATAVITNTGATALTVAGGITAGTGNVAIISAAGKIPAISSTYFASLAGTNLTDIPPAGITGTAAVLGANSFTAAQSIIGGVNISTSASSSLICHYLGAKVTLPATGSECDTVYQSSDHTLYVATQTVTSSVGWKAVW